jgi:hypothetical protein
LKSHPNFSSDNLGFSVWLGSVFAERVFMTLAQPTEKDRAERLQKAPSAFDRGVTLTIPKSNSPKRASKWPMPPWLQQRYDRLTIEVAGSPCDCLACGSSYVQDAEAQP